MVCKSVEWIRLAHDSIEWLAFVSLIEQYLRAWVQNVPPVNTGEGNIIAVGSVYETDVFLCGRTHVHLCDLDNILPSVLETSQSEEMTDL
jgi:hypothetical protein